MLARALRDGLRLFFGKHGPPLAGRQIFHAGIQGQGSGTSFGDQRRITAGQSSGSMARVSRIAGFVSCQIGHLDSGDVGFGAFSGNVGRLTSLGQGGMGILVVVFDICGMWVR